MRKTPTLALGKHEPEYIQAWQRLAVAHQLNGQRGPTWRKFLALVGVAALQHSDLTDRFVCDLLALQNGLDESVDSVIISTDS